ncbi:MAG: TrkA family potassium uptake protein [Ruminococcaceae bacterium]|nr:TrkA family potassium uptake protein [Oscillospiraceae bacterium]
MKKTYAVFGLGRYGKAVVKELVESGAEVIAVDDNEENVDEIINIVPVCKCADVTDPEVIKQLGIENVDTVIISMAGNLESSVMATVLCKDVGVPTVIVKCASEIHGKVLERVGADRVVIPEKESGKRLAKNLLSSGFVDMVELSDGVSMVEIDVKADWIGKSLKELNLRKKYSVNIVALRQHDNIMTFIDPDMPLAEGMKFIVIADTEKLGKLS